MARPVTFTCFYTVYRFLDIPSWCCIAFDEASNGQRSVTSDTCIISGPQWSIIHPGHSAKSTCVHVLLSSRSFQPSCRPAKRMGWWNITNGNPFSRVLGEGRRLFVHSSHPQIWRQNARQSLHIMCMSMYRCRANGFDLLWWQIAANLVLGYQVRSSKILFDFELFFAFLFWLAISQGC